MENKEKVGEVTYKVFVNFNPLDTAQFEIQQEMMQLLILSRKMLANEEDKNKFDSYRDEFSTNFEAILFKLRLMIQL